MAITTSGGGGTWRGETGFYEFGPIIAAQAPHILSSYGVKIIKASSIESTDAVFSEETLGSGAEGKPLLLIYAQNGRVMSDINGSIVRFLFTAKLVDSRTKKIIWTASIDTRTIAGKSIVGKAMSGDFDQKFANDILGAVAARMKKEGLI
ncbi:MAG TPA: hypothetical protein VGM52_05860 [Herbaspirillum sp.]|jgi:hypothetical protein